VVYEGGGVGDAGLPVVDPLAGELPLAVVGEAAPGLGRVVGEVEVAVSISGSADDSTPAGDVRAARPKCPERLATTPCPSLAT
jgi:hypothetical protein